MKLSLCLLGVAVALPGAAHAFCRTTTVENVSASCPQACIDEGKPLYWDVPDAAYTLNERGFPFLSEAEVRATMARSFGEWNAISCEGEPIGLDIHDTPGTTFLEVGPKPLEPNLNTIVHFDAERWAEEGLSDRAYAFTSIWYRIGSGEIVGADTHFNGGMGRFTNCPETGCALGDIDLENVATHEAGHFIGLAHSNELGATMWCDADSTEVDKRSLEADDIAGACAIYPEAWHDPKGKCALSPGSSASGLGALSFGVLALVLRRRRR